MPCPGSRRLAALAVAAEVLDVHPRTIRNWIFDGRLTGYRVGRLLKVDLDEVERLARPVVLSGGEADD